MENKMLSMYNERANIMELQSYLRILAQFEDEIPTPPLSGLWDPQTARCVAIFQAMHHIDPLAPDASYATFEQARDLSAELLLSFSAGDGFFALSNPAVLNQLSSYPHLVAQIQLALWVAREILPQIKAPQINGVWDSTTEDGVCVVQKVCRLPQNGILDRESYNALTRLYNLAMRRLQSHDLSEKTEPSF